MGRLLESGSDTAFYYAVGIFTIAVFVIGMGILFVTDSDLIGQTGLIGFVVGFFLFMLVFFLSISINRLETGDGP